ncbi:DUF1850 domain-containing protein [Falsochrobactrum sp. TDYN1]|uniref:DUF1850 domain-containing protein n=1 Tax=Falsochrobactrum tianjinense TaxID=2706015 RepID=A0A949PLR2_9HYPH|nr:DUF1850 domain-containing protein [Falsochrobactrum sp. TDYN1]MBV2143572.1 DUF1850 domain-containing protein [Falsochrobactrum sp. TDYN1]
MDALCILLAGKMTVIAASVFSLSWTHSVQKTEWREEWQVTPDGLLLTEARVKGSGAGMEPPEGSRLIDNWWVYTPKLPAQKSVMLASSGQTGGGWRLCTSGQCIDFGKTVGAPIKLSRCEVGQ